MLLALCGLRSPWPPGAAPPGAAATPPLPPWRPALPPALSRAPLSSAAPVFLHISGFAFQVPDSVSPGATVSVMNMDGEAHTVTADDGDFDVQVPAGATVTFTAPTAPGSYAFTCTYHANMHGVLVVA